MARVLIVGCGCRGQSLAAALGEHAVRGTTRSAERLPELELDDVDQMIEAQNTRRRASGRREISEEDVRAQVAADERWRDELRRRAREGRQGPGSGPAADERPPPPTADR